MHIYSYNTPIIELSFGTFGMNIHKKKNVEFTTLTKDDKRPANNYNEKWLYLRITSL
jgi:hypothetical protein